MEEEQKKSSIWARIAASLFTVRGIITLAIIIGLVVASFFYSTILYLGIALIILMFMIAVHELGHYTAGKLLGFKITEFALGMGKAIYKKTNLKTGEVFSVRVLPIGGFCTFAGDDGLENKALGGVKAEGAKGLLFNEQPPWKRLIVLFAGAFFNFICAIIFAVIMLSLGGYYRVAVIDKIITSENISIQAGDIIHEVDGQKMTLFKPLVSLVGNYKLGDEITFLVERAGGVGLREVTVEMHKLDADTIGIGVTATHQAIPMNFLEAVGKCLGLCFEVVWLTLSAFGQLITGKIALSEGGGRWLRCPL